MRSLSLTNNIMYADFRCPTRTHSNGALVTVYLKRILRVQAHYNERVGQDRPLRASHTESRLESLKHGFETNFLSVRPTLYCEQQ